MTCILMIFDSSLEFRNTRYIFSIMHKYLSAHIFERYFFNCFSWFDGKPLHQPSELFGCEAFNYKSFDPVRFSSAEQVKRTRCCRVLYAKGSEYSGKTVYTIPQICSATYYVYFRKPNCVIQHLQGPPRWSGSLREKHRQRSLCVCYHGLSLSLNCCTNQGHSDNQRIPT